MSVLILRSSVVDEAPSALPEILSLLDGMSSGGSQSYANGSQNTFGHADLEWQSAFYYDAVNGLAHLMGKPANDTTAWKHQYFDLEAETWTVVSSSIGDQPGHVYGNTGIDPTTGNLYQAFGGLGGEKKVRRYRHGIGWGTVPSGNLYAGALVDIGNGLAVHPDLYGAGEVGFALDTQFRTLFWRASTDGVQDTAHGDSDYGNEYGAGCYWPDQNALVIGGANQRPGTGTLVMITPNGTSTPTSADVGAPPIYTAGDSKDAGYAVGSLHVHPLDATKLMILETNGSRTWTGTYSAGSITWNAGDDHPFTVTPRVVCAFAGYGFWALGKSDPDEDDYSVIFRP